MDRLVLSEESLFKGRTREQTLFYSAIGSNELPAPILSVSGPGWIGKSSLLNRFAETAQAAQYKVLRANLEDCKTPQNILYSLSQSTVGIHFKKSKDVAGRLERLSEKIIKLSKKEFSHTPSTVKDFVVGGAGSAIGMALGGPLGAVVGAASGAVAGRITEAALKRGVDFLLAAGISREDLAFACDPDTILTAAFLEDVNASSTKERLLVMLDGYERVTHLDDWIRFRLIEGQPLLDERVIIVVAGRDPLPDKWKKLKRSMINLPLAPLAPNEATSFLRQIGIHSKEQLSRIIKDSKCIPGSLNLIAQAELHAEVSPTHAAQYSLHKKGQFAEHILDHLSAEHRRLVEASSILRRVDQDILSALIGQRIGDSDFRTVSDLGFVEMRSDGSWSIQEVFRTDVELALKQRSSDEYEFYHQAALTFYMKRLDDSGTPNLEAAYEAVYHAFRVNEQSGIDYFQVIFRRLSWPPNFPATEALLRELSLAVERGDCCSPGWEKYFTGLVFYLKNDWTKAKQIFEEISDNETYSDLLRAKALEEFGLIEFHQGHIEKAFTRLKRSQSFFQKLNVTSGIESTLNDLGRISRRMGRNDLAMAYHQIVVGKRSRRKAISSQPLIGAFRCIGRLWRDAGDWQKSIKYNTNSLNLARSSGSRYDEALALSRLAEIFCFQGKWGEAQIACDTALPILQGFGNRLALAAIHENAGRLAMWVGHNDEALSHYFQALWFYTGLSASSGTTLLLFDLTRFHILNGAEARAQYYLHWAEKTAAEVGDRNLTATCLSLRGELMLLQSHWEKARETFLNSSTSFRQLGNKYREAEALLGLTIALQKGAGAAERKSLSSAKRRINVTSYKDLSLRLSLLESAIDYDQGRRATAIRKYNSTLRKAENFSLVLAKYLANPVWALKKSDPNNPNKTDPLHDTDSDEMGFELAPSFQEYYRFESTNGLLTPILPRSQLSIAAGRSLVLVHHSLTDERVEGRIQGRRDPPLGEKGINRVSQVAKEVCDAMVSRNVDLKHISLYSAPARRCYETSAAIADEVFLRCGHYVEFHVRSALENVGLGAWEGHLKDELQADPLWHRMSSGRDFAVRAPGLSTDGTSSECLLQVLHRAFDAFAEISQSEENTIVVGHKMSVMLSGTLFFYPKLLLDHEGSINWRKLEIPYGGYMIIGHDGFQISG